MPPSSYPVNLFLPDGSQKTFDHSPTGLELAQSIGPQLARQALGVLVTPKESSEEPKVKETWDLRLPLPNGSQIEILTPKNPRSREVLRHSCAHIMAQAVQTLWPEVKVTIGPVIDSGFYYDFDSPFPFTEDDLPKIEEKMRAITSKDFPLMREIWSPEKAIDFFTSKGEKFKVEIIQDLLLKEPTTPISIYRQGDWVDLCRGPHVQSTGQVGFFKLLSVAGAFWRGDEKKPMLQRIYGTAFENKKELEDHLTLLEEAKRRDHRRLGKELGLFQFHPQAPGSPFFTGKGTVIYNELVQLMREMYLKYGYQEVITPIVFDTELFETSGHMSNFKENMYFTHFQHQSNNLHQGDSEPDPNRRPPPSGEEKQTQDSNNQMEADGRSKKEQGDPTQTEGTSRQFALKPMNCPSHCLMFGAKKYSYRDLPLRMADFGRLHRFERAGALHGLTRVRNFCQDDAHIFCTLDQLPEEIKSFLSLLDEVYSILGMTTYQIYFSTRPPQRLGSDEVWDQAEEALRKGLESSQRLFILNPGDGAFYGPKLDIMFVDAIQRPWQLGTLQCDFNLPNRFELKYMGADNQEKTPVMLHRAILGSLERFIGVYIEHCGGHLPPWLCPVQVVLLTITDRVGDYAREVQNQLKSQGLRVTLDDRNEKLGYKIREAQVLKIPFMLVLGDQEAKEGKASLRLRNGKNFPPQPLEPLVNAIVRTVKNRYLDPDMSNIPNIES